MVRLQGEQYMLVDSDYNCFKEFRFEHDSVTDEIYMVVHKPISSAY